jgi:hypothetical protein
MILNLDVCILFRVLDQVHGFILKMVVRLKHLAVN